MAKTLKSLPGWRQTANALFDALAFQHGCLMTAQPSVDPTSDFAKLNANITRLRDLIDDHVRSGLHEIDAAIGASSLAVELKSAADQAKKEADRIKAAIKTVEGVTKFVDQLAGVVELFSKVVAL